MDRMIASLWRGADLSTISRDRGYGASLQEKETCALEEDDAEMLTETLNEYVDKWVIRYLFGPDATPLANVKVLVTPEECTDADLKIDQFLYQTGAPLALHELLTRYGRTLPKPGEAIVYSKDDPFPQLATVGPVPSPGALPTVGSSRREEALNYSPNSAPRVVNNSSDSAIILSSPASSHPPDLHASNSEDAHDSDLGRTGASPVDLSASLKSSFPPVTSRDSSPSLHSDPSPSAPSAVNNSSSVSSVPLVVNHNLANAGFTLLQPDWIQLSPYGDFPHSRGLQRVDREAAETMARQFNSFRSRLGRLFGGAPFYVGHPDIPSSSELSDKKAYGWVMQLEARDDGLYGFVKWSDAGQEMLQQAHYKYFSPYWEAKAIGREGDQAVYRPTALISVGLTNQPNIPVKPLANETSPPEPRTSVSVQGVQGIQGVQEIPPSPNAELRNPSLPALSSDLPEPYLQSEKNPHSKVQTPQSPDRPANIPQSAPRLAKRATPPGNKMEAALGTLIRDPQLGASVSSVPLEVNHPAGSAAVPAAESALSADFDSNTPNPCPSEPPTVSNSAVPDSVLSPQSCATTAHSWALNLSNIHTQSITENIALRRGERFLHNNRHRIRQAVRSQMRLGLTYDEAWQNVKQEHQPWFANENI